MTRTLWLLVFVLLMGRSVCAEEPAEGAGEEQRIAKWVAELDAPQYRVRELATYRLMQAGDAAVPALEEALRGRDLETSLRALQVLRRLAEPRHPDEPVAAWDSLKRIAAGGLSSAATRAKVAVAELQSERLQTAVNELAEVGVSLEYGEFPLGMQSINALHIRVPPDWSGRPDSLVWMRWLHGVKYAALEGPAVDGEMIGHVAGMADLEFLTLREAPRLTAEGLAPLRDVGSLQFLDLQYVPLGNDAIDALAELPVAGTIRLFGTQIDKPTAEALQDRLATTTVEHAGGGFLGVATTSHGGECVLGSVVPDSAADRAGLQPDDVITRVNETEISEFSDLQKAIGQFTPGAEVTIRYRRGGEQRETVVELGRYQRNTLR